MRRRDIFLIGAGLLASAATACAPVRHRAGGPVPPPPLRPVPGYRIVHSSGVVLIYDGELALYIVEGWPSYYYFDGWFYYFNGTIWLISAHFDGPWGQVGPNRLPPGLQALHRRGNLPAGPPPRGKGPR